ncbi:hypothetical protein MFLO_02453 [Listeria floridensis FSL S10-1187]|uniref:Uncharacterized protein n=1 Tax=Listeria floridensis FSL S10-1187 TaxID=1265817 RepID=A0ABP3B106_9LIST|nr:hypothetical protein MFLO_02453 [Listeria floridensis FSL S10-1187]
MLSKDRVVTTEVLLSFKERNRISHNSEDSAIRDQLYLSYLAIVDRIGEFDPLKYGRGLELVFERTRYVRNDALEYFNSNFQNLLLEVSLETYKSDEGGV